MAAALALGTAQFGLAYGLAGREEPVPPAEAKAILRRAWELGIERLDTAPAYGDIEARLGDLAGDLPFSIVSKIAPLPQGGEEAVRDHVRASIARSRARLGERLTGLLFHQADDLLGDHADAAWAEAGSGGVPAGPSCYDAATLDRIATRFPVAMAQLPGNALDQQAASLALDGIEISLRSVFLQGLLLLPAEQAVAKVPAAAAALQRWHAYCAEEDVAPLEAAFSVAKGLPGIDYCLVGVDSLAQLEELAAVWEAATPRLAPALDTRDAAIIDPRQWSRIQ